MNREFLKFQNANRYCDFRKIVKKPYCDVNYKSDEKSQNLSRVP